MSETEFRPLNTGDAFDDDADILNRLVEQQANPPSPLPDEMTSAVSERPARITRLQSGLMSVEPGWDPIRILTPDTTRTCITIAISSSDVLDVIRVSDTADSARYAGIVFHDNPLILRGHTGAVWVYNDTANAINVSYWSVNL